MIEGLRFCCVRCVQQQHDILVLWPPCGSGLQGWLARTLLTLAAVTSLPTLSGLNPLPCCISKSICHNPVGYLCAPFPLSCIYLLPPGIPKEALHHAIAWPALPTTTILLSVLSQGMVPQLAAVCDWPVKLCQDVQLVHGSKTMRQAQHLSRAGQYINRKRQLSGGVWPHSCLPAWR